MLKRWFAGTSKEQQTQSKQDIVEKDGELRISFFGGKGGVGKTTCSTAYALSLAQAGYRTLLVSTDPAHSLADLLEMKVASRSQVAPNLWVQEIDPEAAAERYIQEVKQNLQGLASPDMWKEIERQLDFATAAPGADEAALFDELVTIILDSVPIYDHLVFDTAPTGHTLRLLSLPELMGVWIEGMLSQRRKTQEMHRVLNNIAGVRDDEPADRVYDLLHRRKQRFNLAQEWLLDSERTSFYFVLNPERLPILETAKALDTLNKYGVAIGGLVVNRVLPVEADGDFLIRRRQQEQQYLAEIKERFPTLNKLYIPMQPTDIQGLAGVQELSQLVKVFISK